MIENLIPRKNREREDNYTNKCDLFSVVNWFRQHILIRFQLAIPDSVIYSVHYDDYVGQLDIDLEEFNQWASSHPSIYRNCLSAVRWRMKNGERQLEVGSWAYRGSGRLSDFQYHFSPIKDSDGNLHLYCHREHNPLRHPFKHLKEENFWGLEGVKFASKIDFSQSSADKQLNRPDGDNSS